MACRAKADKKLDVGGSAGARDVALQKCREKLSATWAALEAKATADGGSCPTSGDEAPIETRADAHAHRVNFEVSGLARFVDNGDGTISDRRTGLMWEKKNNGILPNQFFTNPHAAGLGYHWSVLCGNPAPCQIEQQAVAACTGAAVGAPLACDICPTFFCEVDQNIPGAYTTWGYLSRMNAVPLAGHADWRVPTLEELRSLMDLSRADNAIDPAFDTAACASGCADEKDGACSCNAGGPYLTVNEAAMSTPADTRVWMANFATGAVTPEALSSFAHVRLVRGACVGATAGTCD